jgi:hypothetical protein
MDYTFTIYIRNLNYLKLSYELRSGTVDGPVEGIGTVEDCNPSSSTPCRDAVGLKGPFTTLYSVPFLW